MRFLLAALITIPAMASEPWTGPQIAMEGVYQAALLCDWRQTSDFHKTWKPTRDGCALVGTEERNPILGRSPSQARINQACLFSAIGHLVISDALPSPWRPYWQGVTAGLEVAVVGRNRVFCKVAIKF